MDSTFFTAYFWVATTLSLLLFVYMIYLTVIARSRRPIIQKSDIIFQERFASGSSQKNVLTRLGGARNCLRIVVTKDLLWVTSWFPFTLLTTFYDLEHAIPRHKILKVETNADEVLLTYAGENGASHFIKLLPKNVTGFMSALNKNQSS